MRNVITRIPNATTRTPTNDGRQRIPDSASPNLNGRPIPAARQVNHSSDDNVSQSSETFLEAAIAESSNGARQIADPVSQLSLSRSNSEVGSSVTLNSTAQELKNQRGFRQVDVNLNRILEGTEWMKNVLVSTKEHIKHEERNMEQLKDENSNLKGKVARLKTALNKTFLGRWFDKHHKPGMTCAIGGGVLSAVVGSAAATVAIVTISGLATGGLIVAAWPVLVAATAVGGVILAGVGVAWCSLKIRDYCKIAQAEKNPQAENLSLSNREGSLA